MIIRNSIVPRLLSVFINAYAVAIYPWIFIRDEGNDITINHERIHLKQQRELWLIGFYLLYVMFWFIGLIRHRNAHTAYYEIPFEREARANEGDWVYLLNRRRFAWRHYI